MIDPKFFDKSWSESNYLFIGTKIFVFWYDAMVMWPAGS